MDAIKVDTRIQSRYSVFDASGRLPFDIVFGLYRHSPSDTDPRDVAFPVAESALDLPHALAKGLLTLHELDPSHASGDSKAIDLTDFKSALVEAESPSEWLNLPAGGHRSSGSKENAFTLYRYRVKHDGVLASLFKPGMKYLIQFATPDLGVQQLRFTSNDANDAGSTPNDARAPNASKLVVSKSLIRVGRARFTAVDSLSWPPTVETSMRLSSPPPGSDASIADMEMPRLQVTITNAGPESLSVQSRGHQRFMVPHSIFEAEDDGFNDSIRRLVDPSPSTANLQITEVATGKVVRTQRKQSGCRGLRPGNADLRAKVEDLVVLEPGVSVIRCIDVSKLFRGLEDGDYTIRVKPKGCWWHVGDIESDDGDEGKIPARLISLHLPPLVFDIAEEVKVVVKDGRVVSEV
ncbi:hypothetical protein Q7P37_008561 [Cladosporium fusiforme]